MERKKVVVKKDEESQEHYFDINDFKDLFNIDEIEYYEFESDPTDKLGYTLTFYDKNKKILLPKVNK